MRLLKKVAQHAANVLSTFLRGPNQWWRKVATDRETSGVRFTKGSVAKLFCGRGASIFRKILALGAVTSMLLIPLFRSLDINIFPAQKISKADWNNPQTCSRDQFCVYIYDFSIQDVYRSMGGIKYLTPGRATYGEASEYQFNYNDAIFKYGPPAADGYYKAWVHGLNSNYYVIYDFNSEPGFSRRGLVPQWIFDEGFNPNTYSYDSELIWPHIPADSYLVNNPQTNGPVDATTGQWIFLFVDQYSTSTPGPSNTPGSSTATATRTITRTHTPVGPSNTPTSSATVPSSTPTSTAATSTATSTVLTSTATSTVPTSTNTATVPTNTPSTTGSFTITYTPSQSATSSLTPTQTCIVPDDSYERDNIAGDPEVVPDGMQPGVSVPPITVDGPSLLRNISCLDQDIYGYWYGADHVYFGGDLDAWYEVRTYDLESNVDTYIELWYLNKNTGLIESLGIFDDDSGPGLGSQFVFQASQNTRYYVKIYTWNVLDDDANTEYRIEVNTTGGPTSTATVTPTTTGTILTSTVTSTATPSSSLTVSTTASATPTETWGVGDWSDYYYQYVSTPISLPLAMHRQDSIDGQWLGYTVTWNDTAVNNPPDNDDGILINGIWPDDDYNAMYDDVFPVYFDQYLQLSACFRFVPEDPSIPDPVKNYSIGIWIDWNGDGDFADSDEERIIASITSHSEDCRVGHEAEFMSLGFQGRYQVKSALVQGEGVFRALRIRAYPQGATPTAGGAYDNGEVEDYLLYIDEEPTATPTFTVTMTSTVTDTATVTTSATATATIPDPVLFQIEKTPGQVVECGNPGDIVRVMGNHLEDWRDVQDGELFFQYDGIIPIATLSYANWFNNEVNGVVLPSILPVQITPDAQGVIWAQRHPDYAISNALFFCFYTPTPDVTTTFTPTTTSTRTVTFTVTATFSTTASQTSTSTPSGTYYSSTPTQTASSTQTSPTFTPTPTEEEYSEHEVLIKVKDEEDSDPIEDALVELDGDDTSYREDDYTDDDGEVLFTEVENDWYDVTIDYCDKTFEYRLHVEEDDDYRITKTYYINCDTYTVTVHVEDLDGDPIEDATVVLDGRTLYSDDDGEAVFEDIEEGTYTANAEKDDQEGSRTFDVPDELDPVIVLGDVRSLIVHTIDADTQADIQGVTVRIGSGSSAETKTTNTVGRAYFDEISVGNHWAYITYCDYDETPFAFTIDEDDPDQVEVTFELTCGQRYKVIVHVHNNKGGEIANATVVLDDELQGTTGSNGTVTFSNIPSGWHEVVASKDGKTGTEEFRVPDELEPVVIIDVTGLPATGVALEVLLPFVILFLEGMALYFLSRKPKVIK